MRHLALLLAALPAATLAAAWYALRPAGPAVGAWRLAAVRAGVVVGAYAVMTVELLSAVGALARTGLCVAWLAGLAVAGAGAAFRHRTDPPRSERRRWARLGTVEWLVVAGLALIAAGTLVVALAAEPNNWDSQAYHLPKVEQWAANGSVGMYPTNFFLQSALAPGAEYLLLHLRLLTGGDLLYNLVQWGGGLLCALAASRVAAQLGAGRLGQLAAAFVVATAPAVVLEATSTQTDLLAAAWCACAATLAVGVAWSRSGASDTLLLGAALGLATLTKSTGMVVAGLMVALWFAVRAARVRSSRAAARLAGSGLAVTVAALAITGPFLARMAVTYANPLGPPEVAAHAMGRQDPPAVAVNAARLLQTATMVPDKDLNGVAAQAVRRFASSLGEDVTDPLTTRAAGYPAPYVGDDEDISGLPVQAVAVGAGLLFCLVRRRALPYALTCLVVAIAFAATIRWQWYVTRLLLPGLVVAAPLAGLAADALARRVRAIAAAGLAFVVVVAGYTGVHAILFGSPRPLYGTHSVLYAGAWQSRFSRMPEYLADYRWAAGTVRAAGAERVGLVNNDTATGTRFEYPMWVLLRGLRLVNLSSTVPGQPAPPSTSVNAIVCFAPPPPDCAAHVPPGWQLHHHGNVAVALPATP
ncbi:hypothetical protein [Planosporangium mesophilum]|uniref:Glycosyltransferase RgtA/B/C/D-like domain-containing protein n=1 Tax=Planosporangium mesophilum TaxID=689768 RepID=A0A8J3X2U8_9ACTN|nr:hypothetical protein [Planosporangium mesophilum]NJC82199.1 hypothetical protein [Planosporangium mesophilum]GII22248.1 hypothetical protein Pme01_18450 [Planosporangium mesophilum]